MFIDCYRNSYLFVFVCFCYYTYDFIWKSSQDDSVLIWKYWEINHFDSVLNLEILENQSGWLRIILFYMEIQSGWFRIDLEYIIWTVRAGGRPGRVTEKHRERIHFGNMYPEKAEYCIYHWILTLGYFYKKDARRKMTKIGPIFEPRSLIWDRFRPENWNW